MAVKTVALTLLYIIFFIYTALHSFEHNAQLLRHILISKNVHCVETYFNSVIVI